MILFVLIIIISLIVPFIVCYVAEENCIEIDKLGVWVITPIVAILLFIVLCRVPMTNETTMELVNEKKIYSIGNDIGISGRFVFGSGYIGSDIYYYFYEKDDIGIYISQLNSRNVTLVEREDNEPIAYLKEYKIVLKNEDWFFAWGKDIIFWGQPNRIIVELPKGSIKYNYNISLN